MPAPCRRVLSPAEGEAVLAAISDTSVRWLATVAVHTGLRQGELPGLTWADVDLEAAHAASGMPSSATPVRTPWWSRRRCRGGAPPR